MITITKNGNAVLFEFEENSHYLYNGTIEVPLNSLSLVTDESEMFTFKKAATNDIFISARYDDVNMSKSQLIDFYIANMVGGTGGGSESGITSGDVESMIEASLQDYYDIDEIDAALSGKADTSAVTESINAAVSGKADTSSVYTKSEVDTALSGKQDTLIAGSGITISGNVISAEGGSITIDPSLDSGSTNAVANSAITNALDSKIQNFWTNSTSQSTIRLAITKNGWSYSDKDLLNLYNGLKTRGASGLTIDLNENQEFKTYSAATDARISGKADSSAVTQEISAAVSGKQDTLVAGENISISGNVISADGGGKAILAGANIRITTGETADTINCALPIGGGSGNNSIIVGTNGNNSASGKYSAVIGGNSNNASSSYSLVGGRYSNVSNDFETAFGNANVTNHSSSSMGDSGNTIFSVGNGTNNNIRHNALEIRQDGSILIADLSNGTSYNNRPMIKLQDALGGGGGVSESAFTAYSAATDARISEDEEVTAAAFNALNDELSAKQDTLVAGSGITINGNVISAEGGNNVIELTQAQYDALVTGGTVDPNAFYIITDATEINISDYYTSAQTQSAINAAVSGKQDTLIAGSGITISGNVISANGGGSITVDTALDSGSTNPVENRVIYDKFDEVEQVTAAALNALNDRVDAIDITVDDALDATSENPVQNKVIYAVIGDIESLLSNI